MSWVKLDDQFTDHPKIAKAGPMAAWMFVCGLAYCARYLTDGFIPKEQIRRLADIDNAGAEAQKLVSVGLWHEADGGFMVNDYLEYNPTAEKVKSERSAAKERMSRHRSPELRPNNPRSSASPSPSPIPEREEKNPPSAGRAPAREAAPKPPKVKPMNPAVTAFHERRIEHMGKPPSRKDDEEKRAGDLWAEHGETAYRKALEGYFGCLNDSDDWPKRQGFTFIAFLRQFDKWEAGQPPSLLPARASPGGRSLNGSREIVPLGQSAAATAAQQEADRIRAIMGAGQ